MSTERAVAAILGGREPGRIVDHRCRGVAGPAASVPGQDAG
ncbi:hypothetical protein [Pseudonocardia autotrophica]|nr:hypothetical protein [Pseudonocardia autotrophica]